MWLISAFLAALLLDALLGDPRAMPHPVRGLGRLIRLLERRLYGRRGTQRAAGILLVLLTVGGTVAATVALQRLAAAFGASVAWALEVWLLFTTFAARSLWQESLRVEAALARGDLEAARAAVGMIVGRDAAQLSEQEVIRAAVESVAENGVDGVLAPICYALVGGAPWALAYKAVNTLDSMVGYRTPRYERFGWAAARLDDVLNYLPARLAAGLLVLAASFSLRRGAAAWRIVRRDHARHPSPNAGVPEAAVAGALGVRLGGPSAYQGVPSCKPSLGDQERPLARSDIRAANRLVLIMTACGSAAGVLLRLLLARWSGNW
ncbi:MAG: cobalamin biosynthesis protein CobD [Candidatus Tectomicrobia bacterium]|nr:cobalamin biosynthesis protein CobD [Candidatus Tectomicrobia bacterium]